MILIGEVVSPIVIPEGLEENLTRTALESRLNPVGLQNTNATLNRKGQLAFMCAIVSRVARPD
jgi:hypothetical protein